MIEMVIVKDTFLKEIVRAHEVAYGSLIRLSGLDRADLVMIRLSHGGYLPIEGSMIEANIARPAFKVLVSTGEGHGWISVSTAAVMQEGERKWYQQQEVTERLIVALFGKSYAGPGCLFFVEKQPI